MKVRYQPQESARFQAYLSIARPSRQTPSCSALTVAVRYLYTVSGIPGHAQVAARQTPEKMGVRTEWQA